MGSNDDSIVFRELGLGSVLVDMDDLSLVQLLKKIDQTFTYCVSDLLISGAALL